MKKLLIFLIMAIPFSSYSQESDLGNWLLYFGNMKIKNDWNWHNEVQYRNYNAIGDLEQLLIRTGIGYNLTENNNNVLLGYGYILSQNYMEDSDDKVNINEHRIFQQFITRQNIGIVAVQHRYRFEQRFIESDFRMRFRYFLSINIPLNNKDMIDHTVYFSAYNEIFLNTSGNTFDRNRLYGGIGYRFSKTTRLEIGYMNQFLPNTNRDQINIVSFINF
ncbi:DUF2490 domain-containing protein [Algoriphagus machipongonensis]|uniref:DUF2490 domain-containing protein n=1 Tax=Algoriphagus machipongonensis TaxID=388413 RepID=A3HUS4_9BACT|nr:DUF2490 domain-containing protein [Algoriphagus machipongonensis]EAZ81896.1 hypothetical protein ALPR1_01605 [Algoriphagus machipongonensis]